jgi:hypothetical protein
MTANTSGAGAGMKAGYATRENQPPMESHTVGYIQENPGKKAAVRRIQKMLNKKFNANLDVDGILGPLTLKSINKFMPRAKIGAADNPNQTTAVQGREPKNESPTVGYIQEQDPDYIEEKWSQKYKSSINCANPKGFSQRAHCAGRKKNEAQELDEKCWDTHRQVGMKKKGNRMVPNCIPRESVK